MAVLTFSFVQVRKLLLKYQEDKYKIIKTALWLYYVFDMIVYTLQNVISLLYIFGLDTPLVQYINAT